MQRQLPDVRMSPDLEYLRVSPQGGWMLLDTGAHGTSPLQDCSLNNCNGYFDLSTGIASCTENFLGCPCAPNAQTCGPPQSCDLDNCAGSFGGQNVVQPSCTNFFKGCNCLPTANTCGAPQDCGMNGCAGAFNLSDGKAYCQGNFKSEQYPLGLSSPLTSQAANASPTPRPADRRRAAIRTAAPAPSAASSWRPPAPTSSRAVSAPRRATRAVASRTAT
jgi:hypothetical protein